jgi:hypothetical protein
LLLLLLLLYMDEISMKSTNRSVEVFQDVEIVRASKDIYRDSIFSNIIELTEPCSDC